MLRVFRGRDWDAKKDPDRLLAWVLLLCASR